MPDEAAAASFSAKGVPPPLPSWRDNEGHKTLALSDASIAALDESEEVERRRAERMRELTAPIREAAEREAERQLIRQNEAARVAGLSMGKLRTELNVAIRELGLTAARATETLTNADRGAERVGELENQLAHYADLDTRIAAAKAQAVRQNVETPLPPDLIEARAERASLVEQLADARSALALLDEDVTSANASLNRAVAVRDAAATAIITRHAELVAGRVEVVLERLFDLRRELLSVTSIWVPGADGSIASLPVTDKVRVALRRTDERPPIDEDLKAATAAWFERLKTNGEALIDGDPPE
jgi:hypothetical protein